MWVIQLKPKALQCNGFLCVILPVWLTIVLKFTRLISASALLGPMWALAIAAASTAWDTWVTLAAGVLTWVCGLWFSTATAWATWIITTTATWVTWRTLAAGGLTGTGVNLSSGKNRNRNKDAKPRELEGIEVRDSTNLESPLCLVSLFSNRSQWFAHIVTRSYVQHPVYRMHSLLANPPPSSELNPRHTVGDEVD